MNQFEQHINQVPYYDDWGKQRAEIKSVIREFVQRPECEASIYRDHPDINQLTIQVTLFRIYGESYIWFEGLDPESRKIGVSQLERCENDYMGSVLYSCEEDATVITPVVIQLIKEGHLKRIA